MLKANQPSDAIVLNDTSSATATAVNGVTWAKTGLTYIDMAGIGHVSFQTAGTYNVTSVFQCSNDLTNWQSCPAQNVATVPLAENTGVAGAGTGLYEFPVMGFRYFRIAISVYTSGTWTVTATGKAGSAPHSTQPAQAALDGTNTVQIGNTANTTSIFASGLPSGGAYVTASSGSVANAAATATLTSAASKTMYLIGFSFTAGGSTAGSTVSATITGLISGTATFTFVTPANVLLAATPIMFAFPYPIPASATNTNIVVSLPALGAGNASASSNAFGYLV